MLRPLAEQLVAGLAMPAGGIACDVMCDGGVLTQALAHAGGRTATVIACDTDIARARAAASTAHGECGVVARSTDGAALPVDSASCDVVASLINVAFAEGTSLLSDGRRALRQGGVLSVVVWDPRSPPAHEAALARALAEQGASSRLLDRLLARLEPPSHMAVQTLHDVARLQTFTHLWAAMQNRVDDARARGPLDRAALRARYEELLRPHTAADGTITVPLTALLLRDGPAR